jgi:hypothetical protein
LGVTLAMKILLLALLISISGADRVDPVPWGPSIKTVNGTLVLIAAAGTDISVAFYDPQTEVVTAPEPLVTRRELEALRAEFAQNMSTLFGMLSGNTAAAQSTATANLATEISRSAVVEMGLSAALTSITASFAMRADSDFANVLAKEASLANQINSSRVQLAGETESEVRRAQTAEAAISTTLGESAASLARSVLAEQVRALAAEQTLGNTVVFATSSVATLANTVTAATASTAAVATAASTANSALSNAIINTAAVVAASMAAQATTVVSVTASLAAEVTRSSLAVMALSTAQASGLTVVAASLAAQANSISFVAASTAAEVNRATNVDTGFSTAIRVLQVGTASLPATSLVQLVAFGAQSGTNYVLLINGVATTITYRLINGVAYAVSSTPLTFGSFAANWRYSGTGFGRQSIPLTLAGNQQLSLFNFPDTLWPLVTVSTDYVPDVADVCWYVRRRFYIAGGFTYSVVVDDDDVWTLIPPTAVVGDVTSVLTVGGNVADNNGSIDGQGQSNRVATAPPNVYVFAGRGCEGGGADILSITAINAGMDNFFEILASYP